MTMNTKQLKQTHVNIARRVVATTTTI